MRGGGSADADGPAAAAAAAGDVVDGAERATAGVVAQSLVGVSVVTPGNADHINVVSGQVLEALYTAPNGPNLIPHPQKCQRQNTHTKVSLISKVSHKRKLGGVG